MQFIDLKTQQEKIKAGIDARIQTVLAHGKYIMGPEVKFEKLIIEGDRPAGSIARASKDYDLVALGAAKEPFIEQVLFGEIPEKVARYSPASVLVAKQYEGPVHSFFKRVLG